MTGGKAIPVWARRLTELRRARHWSAADVAEKMKGLRVGLPSVESLTHMIRSDWETGRHQPGPRYRPLLMTLYGARDTDVFGESAGSSPTPVEAPAEVLRRELEATLTAGVLTSGTLDDWEQAVWRYGHATRDRPAGVLLADLTSDLVELQRAMARCHSASTLRTITRVVAQMAGLTCLTLIKLDDRRGFRGWARTARTAAQEAGDRVTYSWVLAQEAYGHYYAGDLLEAIDVARQAQEAVPSTPCVGAALAAALEARAHAAIGPSRRAETHAALGRAEAILARLEPEFVFASAFGYNEAQLRFHQGNAFTHLGDTAAARPVQQQALDLCPPSDFLDRTLTQLDMASCLAQDGDPSSAMAYALDTLTALTEQQRRGIITVRGHELVAALPQQEKSALPARDFHDLLMATTDAENQGARR